MLPMSFVFLSVLIFSPFSSTFCQESNEAQESENSFIRNLIESTTASPNIDPAVLHSALPTPLGRMSSEDEESGNSFINNLIESTTASPDIDSAVLLSVLLTPLGRDSSEDEESGNSSSQKMIFGSSPDFHGIDPVLFLLSLTFRQSNIYLECLRTLSSLFGRNSLFPALNLKRFISINNYSTSFPFEFPTKTTLINFGHLVPLFQNSKYQLLPVLDLCNEAGDNNYSVLLFLYYLLSTNSPIYLNQFPSRLPLPSTKCTNYEGIIMPFYINRKNFAIFKSIFYSVALSVILLKIFFTYV